MSHSGCTWRGVPLEDMSKAELISALKQVVGELETVRRAAFREHRVGYAPYGISPGMQALPEIRAVTRLDGAERVKAYASHVQRRLFGRS